MIEREQIEPKAVVEVDGREWTIESVDWARGYVRFAGGGWDFLHSLTEDPYYRLRPPTVDEA